MADGLVLQGNPTDDQKERLEQFLAELMLVSRKYQILLIDPDEDARILDLPTHSALGLGLALFTAPDNPNKVISYVPVNSILDGSWLVDTPDGPVEQRFDRNVFPLESARSE